MKCGDLQPHPTLPPRPPDPTYFRHEVCFPGAGSLTYALAWGLATPYQAVGIPFDWHVACRWCLVTPYQGPCQGAVDLSRGGVSNPQGAVDPILSGRSGGPVGVVTPAPGQNPDDLPIQGHV